MIDLRGDPWEYDTGPAAGDGWAELFAETPNYRALGRAIVGREAFRWHHRPMNAPTPCWRSCRAGHLEGIDCHALVRSRRPARRRRRKRCTWRSSRP